MKKLITVFLSTIISVASFAQAQKVVLIEEGTGTWCQWCPRGDVYGKELQANYPGQFVFVAVHQGDPMDDEDYSNSMPFIGIPNGWLDRTSISDLDPFTDLPQDMAKQLALIPPAGISVSTTWEASTRLLTMTVSANFEADLNGDYRLAAIVIEDGVTGPAPAYDQSNSYSGGNAGTMGGYEDLPNPVSASIMVYNHVGRYLPGGLLGAPSSLPNSIISGETHSYTYTYTLPNEYNEEYVHVAGILVDASSGVVLNAGKSDYLPGYANAKPFFHSSPQEQGFLGLNYQYAIVTHDPEHGNLTISALTSLPAGLSLNDLGDGFASLTGTPTQLGTFDVTLNVNDGTWDVEQSFQITIGEPQEDWIQVGKEGFNDFKAYSIGIKISPEGIPFVIGADLDKDQAFVYEFLNDTWMQLGNGLPAGAFDVSMAVGMDGMPIVFSEGVISKWNGSKWDQLGSKLPGDVFLMTDVIEASDGTLFTVHFAPPASTIIHQFDGTDWKSLGEASDNYAVWNRFNLDESGNPILIYGTDGQNITYSEVTRWDGSQWNQLGGYVEPSSQTYYDHDVAVTSNGDVFAALTIGVGVQLLNIYKFTNGEWELIKENLAGGATASCNLESDANGNLIVAFRDESNSGKTSVMKYDGINWKYMGLPGFTTIADNQSLAVDTESVPYVAYRDGDQNGRISVKKYKDLTSNIFVTPLVDNQLRLYPNPNTGNFILGFDKGSNYQIINLSGQVVKTGVLDPNFSSNNLKYQTITCTELNNGFYFIKVIGEGGVLTLKFLKQ